MTMPDKILPTHLVELQLAQIDLLQAMYPDEDVITIDAASSALLERLRQITSDEDPKDISLNQISPLSILLALEADQDKTFQLEITFPFTYTSNSRDADDDIPEEPPNPKIRLVQPPWMNKSEASSISTLATAQENQELEDDLFTRIEAIKDAISTHLLSQSSTTSSSPPHNNTSKHDNKSLVRVWFWFPSISTRSKRDDIVNYAPSYNLTGFLISGKPGILCLEGPSERVDAYMKFIKTESWGDIPAYQKKVTERLREVINVSRGESRVFKDMQEITDTLGERRGERANRNDMRLLEGWLVERGLGDALMKVLS